MSEQTRMTDLYIKAAELIAMENAGDSDVSANAMRKIFAELRRARAAEVQLRHDLETATAEAERWQERFEEQSELTDAAQDRVEMLNAVSLRQARQILRLQKLVNEAIDLGEEINENS